MADIKPVFGTSTAITITLAGLATGGARQSTAWDWSQWLDILISLKLQAGASGVAAAGAVDIFVFATTDGGATYTASATASDAAITLALPTEAIYLGRSFLNTNAQIRREGPWSIASAFGGTLPASGGIIVRNGTGAALDATEGNFLKTWQGVRNQVV
jgi:hypothetical protein